MLNAAFAAEPVVRWADRRIARMAVFEQHIRRLLTAELQFRLASAVRLAVTQNRQTLDLPMEWTHGAYRVRYEKIALRSDQADYAASFLHRSATYLLAVAMKDAIVAAVPTQDGD